METVETRRKPRPRLPRAKADRVEARVTTEQKEVLQRAANLQGRMLTEFVVSSARAEAERIIRDRDVIASSVRDSRAFADIVLNPPLPNERLRAAMRRHADEVEDEPPRSMLYYTALAHVVPSCPRP